LTETEPLDYRATPVYAADVLIGHIKDGPGLLGAYSLPVLDIHSTSQNLRVISNMRCAASVML
jgi:hypothetical protein